MKRTSAILTAMAISFAAHAATAEGITIEFVDHIKTGMIEQDVFVARNANEEQVYRVTTEDYSQYLDNTVYSTASGTPHDLANLEAIGPHQKGFDLGMTLGQWLNAKGAATYDCVGGKGSINADFTGLVPNGLYTMWTFYLPIPFTEPFSTYDIPIGARDGSDSVFRADKSGAAMLDLGFEPCLQGSSTQLASGLAVAYHSDGRTYGYQPGTMGDKTHIQQFALLPGVDDMPN